MYEECHAQYAERFVSLLAADDCMVGRLHEYGCDRLVHAVPILRRLFAMMAASLRDTGTSNTATIPWPNQAPNVKVV